MKTAFAILLVSILSGCGSVSQRGGNDAGFAVDTKIVSTSAGITWRFESSKSFIVNVREFNGINRDFAWFPEKQINPESLRKLRYCLEQARDKMFGDEEIRETPGYFGLLVTKCSEYATATAFDDLRLNDANEYWVMIQAGNANNHMPRAQGVRISASGSPFLGARRKISRRNGKGDAAKSEADVKECVNAAADKGVFDNLAMTTGEFSYSSSSIQPFLDRFEKCMHTREYDVDKPS